jgi:hypothetical protein
LNQTIIRVQVGDTIIFVEKIEILKELDIWRIAYARILKLIEVLSGDTALPNCAVTVFWDDVLRSQVCRGWKECAENWTLDEFSLCSYLTEKVFSVTAPHLVEDKQD